MYFLCGYEYGILKFVEVILRRGKRNRENNGGEDPNQGTLCVRNVTQNPLTEMHI
jgi:hypothetical protein